MNMKVIGVATLALMLCCGTAGAAELLVTQGMAKRGAPVTSFALDVVSDGNVRGFDFVIPIEKGMKVDTSKCLAGLPHGFQGTCQVNGNEVSGLVFSWEPVTLPAGVHAIGSITLSGRAAAKSLSVKFNAADTDAKPIVTSVTVE